MLCDAEVSIEITYTCCSKNVVIFNHGASHNADPNTHTHKTDTLPNGYLMEFSVPEITNGQPLHQKRDADDYLYTTLHVLYAFIHNKRTWFSRQVPSSDGSPFCVNIQNWGVYPSHWHACTYRFFGCCVFVYSFICVFGPITHHHSCILYINVICIVHGHGHGYGKCNLYIVMLCDAYEFSPLNPSLHQLYVGHDTMTTTMLRDTKLWVECWTFIFCLVVFA